MTLTPEKLDEAGRDLAAHIAEAIGRDLAAHIAEAIEKERFEIAIADLYRKALEEVIRDALKVFRPQAQEANAEAVMMALDNGWLRHADKCAFRFKGCCDCGLSDFLAQHGGQGDE